MSVKIDYSQLKNAFTGIQSNDGQIRKSKVYKMLKRVNVSLKHDEFEKAALSSIGVSDILTLKNLSDILVRLEKVNVNSIPIHEKEEDGKLSSEDEE